MVRLLDKAITPLLRLFQTTRTERASDPREAHLNALEALYLNSGVYDHTAEWARLAREADGLTGLRSLRNPTFETVEFYAGKIGPYDWFGTDNVDWGELVTNAAALTTAGQRVLKWSDWESNGRESVRVYGWSGNAFTKVSDRRDEIGEPTGVYLETIDPRHVIDFDKDDRGFFTYLRITTPKTRRVYKEDAAEPESEDYFYTEIWDKRIGVYRIYEHDGESDLGDETLVRTIYMQEPPEDFDLDAYLEGGELEGEPVPEFAGFDFVPVVHAKLRDVGADWGMAAVGHALPDVKEADRIATKLHELLFPDVTWTLQSQAVGPDGTSLPAPKVRVGGQTTEDGKGWARGYTANRELAEGVVKVAGEDVARVPSGWQLEPKIPDRRLIEHAAQLDKQLEWVRQKLPETQVSRLRDLELSGRAIRYSMADLYDRYDEAFGNYAAHLARALHMAFTIAQVLELDGFDEATIGTYEDGTAGEAWEMRFKSGDPLPQGAYDTAEAEEADSRALDGYKQIGGVVYEKALLRRGYTQAEARRAVREAAVAARPADTIGGVQIGRGRVAPIGAAPSTNGGRQAPPASDQGGTAAGEGQ